MRYLSIVSVLLTVDVSRPSVWTSVRSTDKEAKQCTTMEGSAAKHILAT